MSPIFTGKWFSNSSIDRFEVDPYFSSVTALLHFDNSWVDNSSYNLTINRFNNPILSTTTFKYGSGSAYTNSTGSAFGQIYWTMPSAFGTRSFTIEMWINPLLTYTDTNASIFTLRPAGGTWDLGLIRDGTSSDPMKFSLIVNTTPQTSPTYVTVISASTSTQIAFGVWSHIAVVRSGNTYTLYINGVNSGSGTSSYSLTGTSCYLARDSSGARKLNSYFDDVRITTVARYASDFTVPPRAFPNQ